jgi:hypothetical protein
MTHDALLLSCAGYALGILDRDDRLEFEAHLTAGCPECEAELVQLATSVAILGGSLEPRDASRRLKRRVLSRIVSDGFYFADSADAEWEPAGVQGIELRRLFIQPEDDRESLVVRMAAGTRHESLTGVPAQACYVLDGDLEIGGSRIAAGETCRLEAGAPPARWSSERGCSVFVTTLPAPLRGGTSNAVAVARVRPDDLQWVPIGPGAFARPIFVDAQGGQNAIARMDAGYVYAEHHHAGAEELFVLEGDVAIHGHEMGPGDYHRSGRNTDHGITSTRGGCALILVTQP